MSKAQSLFSKEPLASGENRCEQLQLGGVSVGRGVLARDSGSELSRLFYELMPSGEEVLLVTHPSPEAEGYSSSSWAQILCQV